MLVHRPTALVCMVHLEGSSMVLKVLAAFQKQDGLSSLHCGPPTSLTNYKKLYLQSLHALTCHYSWGN